VYPATSTCPSSNTSFRRRHPTYHTNSPHVPPDGTSSTPIVMPKSSSLTALPNMALTSFHRSDDYCSHARQVAA
jgi:hypothetical protein